MRNKVLTPKIAEEELVIPIEYIKKLGDVEVVFQNDIILRAFYLAKLTWVNPDKVDFIKFKCF